MARRKANKVYTCACSSQSCADHFQPANGHNVGWCLGISTINGGMCDECREFQMAEVTVSDSVA
jgi:hypothetical protein